MNVTRVPSGEFHTSSVRAPHSGLLWDTPGRANLDTNDLTPVGKPGGTQRGAIHEGGHMVGLGDGYETGATAPPQHSHLAEKDLGHGVARGADGRIMSDGEDFLPEHGVTFLAGLRDATGVDEWSFSAKAPAPIPANPFASSPAAAPAPATP